MPALWPLLMFIEVRFARVDHVGYTLMLISDSQLAAGDGESSTMLRKRPDSTRDASVWVEGGHCVSDDQVVQVLRLNAEGEQGFAWIRTPEGHEGFIRTDVLRVRPLPSAMIAKATVHRLDGEASTMLRQRPDVSRGSDVWVAGHHVSVTAFRAMFASCNTLIIAWPRGSLWMFCA